MASGPPGTFAIGSKAAETALGSAAGGVAVGVPAVDAPGEEAEPVRVGEVVAGGPGVATRGDPGVDTLHPASMAARATAEARTRDPARTFTCGIYDGRTEADDSPNPSRHMERSHGCPRACPTPRQAPGGGPPVPRIHALGRHPPGLRAGRGGARRRGLRLRPAQGPAESPAAQPRADPPVNAEKAAASSVARPVSSCRKKAKSGSPASRNGPTRAAQPSSSAVV